MRERRGIALPKRIVIVKNIGLMYLILVYMSIACSVTVGAGGSGRCGALLG